MSVLAVMALASTLAPAVDAVDADIALEDARSLRFLAPRMLEPSVRPGAGFRRDLTFRPWTPFFLLKESQRGTWSLLGSTFAGCLDHATGMPCEERIEAGVALAWRPKGSIVSFFAGAQVASMETLGAGRSNGVGFVGGIVVTPASLAALVRSRAR